MALAQGLNYGKLVVHVDYNAEITVSGAPVVNKGISVIDS